MEKHLTGIRTSVFCSKRLSVVVVFLFMAGFVFAQAPDSVPADRAVVYRSLSAAIQNAPNVYRLSLNRAQLSEVPPEIFSLVNLQELDLSRNKLKSIPADIGKLKNLEKLNLSNNKLTALPDEIGELHLLTYLGLNRNQIEALPKTIGSLRQLEILELWDNELYDLPDEIKNLQKLKVLELRGILFSHDDAARFDSLLPNTRILLSPTCDCKF